MNKSELIFNIADRAEVPRATAAGVLEAMVETIGETLAAGDTVAIPGFGTFSVRERAARTGRNPRTGESIQIPASRAPAFKSGKTLKDALN